MVMMVGNFINNYGGLSKDNFQQFNERKVVY